MSGSAVVAAGAATALLGFTLLSRAKHVIYAQQELEHRKGLKSKRILVTRVIETERLKELSEKYNVELGVVDAFMDRDLVFEKVKGCHGVLIFHGDKPDESFFEVAGPQLQIVANYGAGYDTVDVAAATERGVWVSNTPDVVAEDTADLALCLLLSSCRRVLEADAWVRRGEWAKAPSSSGLTAFWGASPRGRTLGIVGLGSIGLALARRARELGLAIVYFNRTRDLNKEIAVGATYCSSLHDLLRKADFVSLHCPLSAATRHLIGEAELEVMKPGVFLINTARGPVIDEEALVRHLRSGKVRGVGLDVFEGEPAVHPGLLELCREGHPHITLTPHIGTATEEAVYPDLLFDGVLTRIQTRKRMFDLCLENIDRVLQGGSPVSPVNSFK